MSLVTMEHYKDIKKGYNVEFQRETGECQAEDVMLPREDKVQCSTVGRMSKGIRIHLSEKVEDIGLVKT
uniref:DUF2969 domain-containing protein n=1 Tax=Steinernema glaseri TaxID=37863 RepID=A0A1I8AG95_9BILA